MATVVKNTKKTPKENLFFKDSYATINEAAEAKTDYLMNVVLKNFDFNKLKK